MTDYETRVIRYLREYYPIGTDVPLTEAGRVDMARIMPGVLSVAMAFALGEMLEAALKKPARKTVRKRK